jgi:hypothetical protein
VHIEYKWRNRKEHKEEQVDDDRIGDNSATEQQHTNGMTV